LAGLTLMLMLLSGCASLSPDAGFAPLQAQTRTLLGQELAWPRDAEQQAEAERRVSALLAQPLSADAAVQIALLNHRGLRAALFDLAVLDAERVQAGRLPNPGLSLARLARGDEREIERGLHFNLARLLALPAAAEVARRRLAQTQQELALQVLAVAAQARQRQIEAVAAEEQLRQARRVMAAAEAGAELARRLAAVGNISRLQQAREHGFYADAALGVARAQAAAASAREALIRALGLWGDSLAQLKLPERLPDLPAQPRELPEVERQAIAQRLDVQAARQATEVRAAELGLSRRTRFVNVLELGLVRNSSNEAPVQRGVELSLELPLFDWGEARNARAEALYLQALERTAEVAINARSEAREAYQRYRGAWDIAQHHAREIVPLRQRIADENILRYNGMLIGTLELLADARGQIAGVAAAIEAKRDFQLAEARLDQALLGPVGAAPALASSSPSSAANAEAGGGH
jgi:outer membrane protein TolC